MYIIRIIIIIIIKLTRYVNKKMPQTIKIIMSPYPIIPTPYS